MESEVKTPEKTKVDKFKVEKSNYSALKEALKQKKGLVTCSVDGNFI
jgi:hypothetical protein